METIYLSLRAQVAVGTFFMKSPDGELKIKIERGKSKFFSYKRKVIFLNRTQDICIIIDGAIELQNNIKGRIIVEYPSYFIPYCHKEKFRFFLRNTLVYLCIDYAC